MNDPIDTFDDNFDPNEIQMGLEYFNYNRFFKDHHIFRMSDLVGRITPITPTLQLPWNSVLHVLDNMDPERKILSDVPDLEHNSFVRNERSRKFIYHNRAPSVGPDEPIHIEEKYIYRDAKLTQNLMKFRQQYGTKYRFLLDLHTIPKANNTLTIINHNPLFRLFVRGQLPSFRRFNVIFASIMNLAAKIPPEKYQYIVIPLSTRVFPKEQFIRTQTKLDMTSIRHKDDLHYLFMIQWLNFINTTTSLSLLEKYPEDRWDHTSFILKVKDSCLIVTLGDMVRLNEGNRNYRKIVNQINMLALTGLGQPIDPAQLDSESVQDQEQDRTTAPTLPQGLTPVTKVPPEDEDTDEVDAQAQHDAQVEEEIEQLFKNLTKYNASDFDISIPEHPDVITTEDPDEDDLSPSEVSPYKATTKNPFTMYLTPNTIPQEQDDSLTEVALSNQDIDTKNIPAYETPVLKPYSPHLTPEDTKQAGIRLVEDLDTQADTIIDNNPHTNARQKERQKKVARLYKTIKLGNKTLEEHITTGVDPKASEKELPFLKDHLVDQSMTKSSIMDLDTSYMENYYHRDLAAVITSFHNCGTFLVDLEEKTHSTEMNRTIEYKMTYEHLDGKRHTVKFSVPHIDKNGYCLINGVQSYMKKQMVSLPICKTSELRVSLASYFNKTIVERNVSKAHSFIHYFQKCLESINATKKQILVDYGALSLNLPISYEYVSLAKRYRGLFLNVPNTDLQIQWTFDYTNRYDAGVRIDPAQFEELERRYGLFLGGIPTVGKIEWHFLDAKNILTVFHPKTQTVAARTTILDLLASLYAENMPNARLSEWVDLKILDKKLPLGFVLAYRFGLKTMLDYTKTKYRVDPIRTRVPRRATDVVLTFKDVVITIPRYPLINSLIFAGLQYFNIKAYEFEDFGDKDIYYKLLVDKGFSTNYLKGIDSTFDLFIDAPTRDVLEQMNEPTNFRDLLIRATEMLTTEHRYEASSMANHRLRSYERINALIYNEMARQYATFQHKTGRGNTFSVNPQAIIQRILQDQAMIAVEDINPIHDIKTKSSVTYLGVGGRSSEAFVIEDRKYPADGVGVLSEATVDSGQVSINAIATMDPTVANIRGIIDTTNNREDLKPTQILSVTSLLMPATTQDDG